MKKYTNLEEKTEIVKQRIEDDIQSLFDKNIENLFDGFEKDERTKAFIKYYNEIVLDQNKINFGTFKAKWAIQGMTKEAYTDFDNNFDERKNEIINEKNIDLFYEKYCREKRNEAIFCCKLFHVILPNEFPPVDNQIIKHFELTNGNKINSYKIIKRGYELFISQNEEKINQIKQALTKEKYDYIRINELSNYRIIDMIYWFILNREKT